MSWDSKKQGIGESIKEWLGQSDRKDKPIKELLRLGITALDLRESSLHKQRQAAGIAVLGLLTDAPVMGQDKNCRGYALVV